jgi:hypothetical protein
MAAAAANLNSPLLDSQRTGRFYQGVSVRLRTAKIPRPNLEEPNR